MNRDTCDLCRKIKAIEARTVEANGCPPGEVANALALLAKLKEKHDPDTCRDGGVGTDLEAMLRDLEESNRYLREWVTWWKATEAKWARQEEERKAEEARREEERKAKDAAWLESLYRDAPPSKWAFRSGAWDFEAELGIAPAADEGRPEPTTAPSSNGEPPAEPAPTDVRAAADPRATATPMPTCDPGEVPGVEQIHDWLAVFARDYPAVEIRVIGATGRKDVFGERFTDLRRAAEYAMRWSGGAKGVYFTLNPLKGPEVKGKTASDEDVSRRMWLFIDADPERGKHQKASATDEEKAIAWEVLCKVRDWLRERGWPEPIVCDSGNGWHLYYRIDLPNDDNDTLVKRVLEALDLRFSTAAVNVDPVNSNAGRITKCFGTLARKGDDTPDRPHRYARVLSVPDVLEVVPRDRLESLAGEPPPPRPDRDAEAERKRAKMAPAEARKARRADAAAAGAGPPTWRGQTVADAYNERYTWPETLEPKGWKHVRTFADGTERWLRPGQTEGSSATIGWRGADVLHVFSSNAAPFKEHGNYSKFDAYVLLHHGGDYSAAAAHLYHVEKLGTRQPPPPPRDEDRPGKLIYLEDELPPRPSANGQHTPPREPGCDDDLGDPEADGCPYDHDGLLPSDEEHDVTGPTATAQTSGGFRLTPRTVGDMEAADLRPRWLVEKILVSSQPCIVGAPKKSMKTSVMIDLSVSLASGTPFLGQFVVPHPVRVLLLSGESGEWAIRDTYRRVCAARGLNRMDLEDMLLFEFQLPKLSVAAHRAELSRIITAHSVDVVIIDPIYLCLISGMPGTRIDPANLFDMGPLLQNAVAACLPATCLLVHHAKKNMQDKDGNFGRYGQPDLDDLSMTGFQEFARQWLLLKRSERYEPGSGLHKLWLSIGGSAGHSGEWEIEIDEGTLREDFTGRKWDVAVKLASEAREAKKARAAEQQIEAKLAKEEQNDAAKDARIRNNARLVRDALTEPLSRRGLRNKLGWNTDRTKLAVDMAIDLGLIEEATMGGGSLLRRVTEPGRDA
ncbi:MAG: AAA family ATPase [Planctomycetaceae bacterium]|nr:AAA family ATPase [Planctomycetaceae bacterium]